jgi:hypothetical protein
MEQAGCWNRPELWVWGGAPRRNRTGDPILTMHRRPSAVLSAVSLRSLDTVSAAVMGSVTVLEDQPLLPRIEQASYRGPGPRSDQAADACKSA